MYRVSRNIMPKLWAVVSDRADRIDFENVKVFSQTRLAFDNNVYDQNTHVMVRAHHFLRFALDRNTKSGRVVPLPTAFAKNAGLKQIATGFSNATGLTVDQAGTVFFTDAAVNSVYAYSSAANTAELLARTPQMPQVIGFVPPSSLMAVDWERTVSRIDTQTGRVTPVTPSESVVPGTMLLLPVGLHNELIQLDWLVEHLGYKYRIGSNTATRSELLSEQRFYFYAPDGKTAIMTGPKFRSYAAWAWRPLPESCQLAMFAAGSEHYITSEDDEKTYIGKLQSLDQLDSKMVIERGGTSVVRDTAGNVYIASGQVYIYDKNGEPAGVLEIPERPSSLAFGGTDRKTLFIGARSSVYAIRTAAAGD
jgi:sugar lactone lactonase YvrE